ncbi:Tripartite tricarboxylate transporter family receptor [Bordetella tumbae]|uniref:tripartite tricarboxylate transporter substrate binding protein n=1 Tax=Bordetella tumbae TaxID=1649139 RepID=UPI0039EFFE54
MHRISRAFSRILLVGGLVALSAVNPSMASYPEKPLKLIVGFPAGGASDVAARAVAEKMSRLLGQPIVVENKAGAASNIASDFVAKSTPDGYTVLFGTISLAVNPSLYRSLSYDPLKDLMAVSQVASTPFMLVTNTSTPYRSVGDLVAAAKEAGDKPLQFASAGNGSGAHLFTELFAEQAGIKLQHVPYRGAAPAMADVLGGHVPITFDNMVTTLPLIKSGQLRALAISTKTRSSAVPDVPTLAESGVPNYDATAWFGLFVSAGTPTDVVAKLSDAARQAAQDPDVKAKLDSLGCVAIGSTPGEFDAFFKSEVDKWAQVVKRANVQLD